MAKKSFFVLSFTVFILFPALVSAVDCAGEVCLDSPIKAQTPQELVGFVINGLLGVVGSLALAMFIYGGFTWMMAAGSAEKVQKGKNILAWASIGLAVIFSAYALVRFVFEGLGITPK
jgi:hypothetical protein